MYEFNTSSQTTKGEKGGLIKEKVQEKVKPFGRGRMTRRERKPKRKKREVTPEKERHQTLKHKGKRYIREGMWRQKGGTSAFLGGDVVGKEGEKKKKFVERSKGGNEEPGGLVVLALGLGNRSE